MIVRATALRPAKLAFALCDGLIVDAGESPTHKTFCVKLPVFVAVGSKPVVAVVTPFISETNRDAVIRERPNFLDQTIFNFPRPFALKK